MREIESNGKSYEIRPLKRKEVREHELEALGVGMVLYAPPK